MSGCELFQGVLQAVVNLAEQAGAQRDREHLTALLNAVTDPDAGGALVDLCIRRLAAHAQDLRLQALLLAALVETAR